MFAGIFGVSVKLCGQAITFVWFEVVESITEILQPLFILLKFKSVVFVQTVQKRSKRQIENG